MHPEWVRMYNADYNDNLKSSDVVTWGTHEYVKPECGKKIYDYLWRPELYDHVEPIIGGLGAVLWLRKHGHRCIFATSGLQPAKIKWLYNHKFLTSEIWQSDPDVLICNDKSILRKVGDILIDDRDKNVEEFGNAILFDQPWNHNFSWDKRACTWEEVLQFIINVT